MKVAAILLAVEMTDDDRPLLAVAEAYAMALEARVYMLHVMPGEPAFVGLPKVAEVLRPVGAEAGVAVGYAYDRRMASGRARAAHAALHGARTRLEARGVSTTALLIEGPTAEKIAREARKLDCGLIIVGTRQRGLLDRLLHGSTARELLHDAPCPVLVVPTGHT